LPLVLAIEPDTRQAGILKQVIRDQVRADLVLVESRDAAVSAIAAQIPDVILVTALLSPRDEEELVNYLRTLDGAGHLQTYTIPQLAAPAPETDHKTGFFGKFKRRKEVEQPIHGCDPALFAEQLRNFLDRAAERKSEPATSSRPRTLRRDVDMRPEAAAETASAAGSDDHGSVASESAWASPFEWRRNAPAQTEAVASRQPSVVSPQSPVASPASTPVDPSIREAQDAAKIGEEELRRRQVEQERLRSEVEALRKRDDEERKRREAEERQRLEAEARRKREEEDRKRRDQEERLRLEAEARRKGEEEERARREEEERKRQEEAERLRLIKAEARRKREEEERKRREEEERQRLEAEARRQREADERKRCEEAERQRLEAEARRKREAEERKRHEEAERQRIEAEARRKRDTEEQRRRAEGDRKRREEDERKRQQAEIAARRTLEEQELRRRQEEHRQAAAASADPFAEFRADHDAPKGVLRLIPLDDWARVEKRPQTSDPDSESRDELQRLFASLRVPKQVAAITYPRGCRIRRVRVRALEAAPEPADPSKPLIVSRRALKEARSTTAR
jgi:hypothetical protein